MKRSLSCVLLSLSAMLASVSAGAVPNTPPPRIIGHAPGAFASTATGIAGWMLGYPAHLAAPGPKCEPPVVAGGFIPRQGVDPPPAEPTVPSTDAAVGILTCNSIEEQSQTFEEVFDVYLEYYNPDEYPEDTDGWVIIERENGDPARQPCRRQATYGIGAWACPISVPFPDDSPYLGFYHHGCVDVAEPVDFEPLCTEQWATTSGNEF